jgi:hypothetical protein
MAGGFFVAQINDGGTIYNLITSPLPDGQYSLGGSGIANILYKTTATADFPSATFQNEVYGLPANDAGNDADHPAFQWARSLNIGGFSDWYIPAKNELEIVYRFLKPTTDVNSTSFGANPNAVPVPTSNYTPLDPLQCQNYDFTNASVQGWLPVTAGTLNITYMCSTEDSFGTGYYKFFFSQGAQYLQAKNQAGYARVIRRTPA